MTIEQSVNSKWVAEQIKKEIAQHPHPVEYLDLGKVGAEWRCMECGELIASLTLVEEDAA